MGAGGLVGVGCVSGRRYFAVLGVRGLGGGRGYLFFRVSASVGRGEVNCISGAARPLGGGRLIAVLVQLALWEGGG